MYIDANVYSEIRIDVSELLGKHHAVSAASSETDRGKAKIGTGELSANDCHASTFTYPRPRGGLREGAGERGVSAAEHRLAVGDQHRLDRQVQQGS